MATVEIIKKVTIGLIISGILLAALGFVADYDKVTNIILQFPMKIWIFILFLSIINYLMRELKWDFYLKVLDIHISKKSSFLVFFSGYIMALTPAKTGELLKSLLLSEYYNVPISKSAPIIFMERLTDLIALLIISFFCIVLVPFYYSFYNKMYIFKNEFFINLNNKHSIALIFIALVTFLIILFFSNKKLLNKVINFVTKIKFINQYTEQVRLLFESSNVMLMKKTLFYTTFLSIIAWVLECIALYFVIIKVSSLTLNPMLILIYSSFAYAISTILGAISMLPGGLFVTEGGMTLLLTQFMHLTSIEAMSASLIIRFATLWFALLIGIIALPLFYLVHKKPKHV